MKNRWSIRVYFWLLAVAVVLPGTAVLIYSIVSDARHAEQEAQATTLSMAQLVASQTQRSIDDAEAIAAKLSHRPAVRSLNRGERPPVLDSFLTLHPQFANIVICDASGRMIHSAAPGPPGKPPEEVHAAWAPVAAKNKRLTIGKPTMGQITGRWVCVLAYPIMNDAGDVLGVIGLAIDLERLQPQIKLSSLPPGSVLTIVDEDGTIIASDSEPNLWVGRAGRGTEIVDHILKNFEGHKTARGLDQRERIYGFTSIPKIGWHVYVGIPTSFTFAATRANAFRAAIFGLALLALVIVLIFLLGGLINRPVRDLSRAATAAAAGAEMALPVRGPREIMTVAEEFKRVLAARQQKEAEIKELNSELEQRVRARTADLEKANLDLQREVQERKLAEAALEGRTKELLAANRELEAFCYSVSHDLRAPLRTIGGFARVLAEDHGLHLVSDGKQYVERIRHAVERMSGLIDDLLELSRVSRSDLVYTNVDLSVLAANVINELRTAAPERETTFSVQSGLTAYGDAGLLRIAIENLLGNAWKFSRHQKPARIEFGAAEQDGETAFFVRDNGVGFEMKYIHKLFGPFERLHSSSEYEGHGIGLATVQRIIHRHGGDTWAEGAPNKGAVFYFTLAEQITTHSA